MSKLTIPQLESNHTKIMVAIYARVSTEEQADNFSIPAQLDLLRSYCRAMGYEIYDEYVDPGHSGTTPNRPELSRLLNDAKGGKFTVVLVYRIDRFFRSTKDLLITVEYLDKLSISFRSVTEPFDTSNPIGKFMLSLLGSVAQLNRDTFIENCMMGKIRRAEEGYVVLSSPSFGWDYIKPAGSGRKRRAEKGHLVINEKEALVVREAFCQYNKPDQSTITVSDYLNSQGYTTKTGGKWTPERVYALLTNPAAIGEWIYKGDIVVPVPPIMDRDTFAVTQELLKERRNMIHRETSRDYLLRGLLRCKLCHRYIGGTTQMHRRVRNGKRVGSPYKETHYYRCITNMVARKQGWDESCPTKWVKGDILEARVLNYLSEILSNPEKLNHALSRQQESVQNKKAEAKKKLKELGNTMNKLATERERVLSAYRSGVIELSDLQKSVEDIKGRQKAVEQQATETRLSVSMEEERACNVLEVVEKHRGNWEVVHSLSFEEKRELLSKTVKCIWVETTEEGNALLDIECYLPASDGQEDITTPPLAPGVQDKRWSSINTFDLAVEVGRETRREIERVRTNIIEALGKVPPLNDIDMTMTVGERLQLLFSESGLLIYELSQISGIAKETIRKIMQGKCMPRVPTAVRLSKAFCVSPGVFLITPEEYGSDDPRVRLKNLRHILGLRQSEFAGLCQIDPASIRDWEMCVTQLRNRSRCYIEAILLAAPSPSSSPR